MAEWLIFNHFGPKARLFEDSIFKPLNKHFLEFQIAHPVAAGDTVAGLGRFDGLQDYFARATAATAKRRGRNVDLDSQLASRISWSPAVMIVHPCLDALLAYYFHF